MTLLEHYLRQNLKLKPKSQLLTELLNYLKQKGYEVDMSSMITEDDSWETIYLKNQNVKASVTEAVITDDNDKEIGSYISIEETEKVNNPESNLFGHTLHSFIDISNEGPIPNIGVMIHLDETDRITFDNDKNKPFTGDYFNINMEDVKPISLDDINNLIEELSYHRLLLTFVASSSRKALEESITKSKDKQKTVKLP